MSIFIDTGIFTGAANIRDKYHMRAKELLADILRGEYGSAYTSDFIFDEIVTLMLKRLKVKNFAVTLGEAILDSSTIEFVYVSLNDFANAWNLFKKMKKHLSFTDCTSLVLMERLNIKYIASFDSDFDGWAQRIK